MISLGILLYARSDRKSLIALPGVSFGADCKSTVRPHSLFMLAKILKTLFLKTKQFLLH